MPIDLKIYPKGRGEREVKPFILPGHAGAITNYVNGAREIIAIECLGNDLGGNVYSFNGDEIEGMLLPAGFLRAEFQIDYIPPGGEYYKEVTSKKSHNGLLVARHIGRNARLLSRN